MARPRRFRRYLRRRAVRRFSKKYVRGSGALTIPKPLASRVAPWTRSAYATMIYTGNVGLTVGVAGDTTNWATYRANSIYDPLFASGGESATGKPEWARMYRKYRVNYVKVWATFVGDSTALNMCHGFIKLTDSSGVSGLIVGNDSTQLGRSRMTRYKVLNNIATGGRAVTLSMGKSIAGMEGRLIAGEGEYESVMSSNPTRVPLILVGVSAFGVQAAATYQIQVRIKYYCQLFEKVVPTQEAVAG